MMPYVVFFGAILVLFAISMILDAVWGCRWKKEQKALEGTAASMSEAVVVRLKSIGKTIIAPETTPLAAYIGALSVRPHVKPCGHCPPAGNDKPHCCIKEVVALGDERASWGPVADVCLDCGAITALGPNETHGIAFQVKGKDGATSSLDFNETCRDTFVVTAMKDGSSFRDLLDRLEEERRPLDAFEVAAYARAVRGPAS